MPHSISLWFDEKSESTIRGMWANLYDAGVPSKYHAGPYRPHVTLVVYNELKVEEFTQALRDYCSAKEIFTLSFESLGAFLRSTGAVYLAPKPTLRLLETQREVLTILSEFGSGISAPHYAVDNWTPHCTLCVGVNPKELRKALEISLSSFRPLDVQVTRIGLIQNPEEIELNESFLKGVDEQYV